MHTIYFQPNDAPELDIVQGKISNAVKGSQALYRNEMNRHGFGNKTFKINENNGKVVINHVRGNHRSNHYADDTYNKVKTVFPDKFNFATPPFTKQDNIHLIIVGGVKLINNGLWGYGWPHSDGTYGGWCVVSMDALHQGHGIDIVAHELGHAFGLNHKDNCNTCLMEAGGSGIELTHYEARWLDKHYHFNDRLKDLTFPKLLSNRPKLTDMGNDIIRFELEVTSNIGLHQSEIASIPNNYITLDWHYFNGKNRDKITFDVKREKWDTPVLLQVMDINGNWIYRDNIVIRLPDKLPENKNPDISNARIDRSVIEEAIDEKVVYLTVNDGGTVKPNKRGLKPLNDENEYKNGWRPELIADDRIQHGEPLIIHGITFNRGYSLTPPDDSNRNSVLKYDLTNNPYIKFEGYFGLSDHHDWHWQQNIHDNPNSCSFGGSCIFTFKIDNTEIHKSEVITGKDSYAFIEFNIPIDATVLEIVINASPDGNGCDSAVIGDPKIFSDEAVETGEAISVNAQNKLTTQWAQIKSKSWR